MSVLLGSTQKLVEDDLVARGIISGDELDQLKHRAETLSKPLFQMLVSENKVSDEELTKSIAIATQVPYVNLHDARINPHILSLLPRDYAERYMAVPLGVMEDKLVVAMLDADNVQAVDFLSSKLNRPLKVYLASEAGN